MLLLIARLILAGVFALAGMAKLRNRRGTRDGILGFGAPARLAGPLALTIPVAEVAVAGLLLPASTALYGAFGALGLLCLFSAALAWNLAHGRTPDCHCFGQLHSAQASWKTLARNGALIGVGALVLAGGIVSEPSSAVAWVASLSGSARLALAVVAVSGVVLGVGGAAFVSLMRSYGGVLTRLERVEDVLARTGLTAEELEMPELGLTPGTPIPFFAATAVGGEPISPETITASAAPTLLLFTSPHCGPCTALLPTVAEWQREHGDRLTVVVASSGSAEDARHEAQQYALERVLHDGDHRLYELFGANGTPSAVLVAPDGTIASWVASGAEWIEQLVAQLLADEDERWLPVGAEAPVLELPSLAGDTIALASLRGRDALLLFWNPECGFCRSLHGDMLEWESSANGVTPRLVVVSSGDADATRADGFQSLVLLDEGFAAGTAFAANGTPMAVLLDADGRIASPMAVGADAILALAHGRR